MEKKKEPDRGTAVLIAAVGMALVLVFCLAIRWDKERVVRADVSELQELTDLACVIENVSFGEYIRIDGHAYVPGESIHTVKEKVLLYDFEEDCYWEIPTQMNVKAELDQADEEQKNYSAGGFLAKVKARLLDKAAQNYEICIEYQNDDHRILYHTGEWLEG